MLLWAVLQQGKLLSSLTHEDVLRYERFLGDPQPAWRWVMTSRKKLVYGAPDWRSFAGSLSPGQRAACDGDPQYAVHLAGGRWLPRRQPAVPGHAAGATSPSRGSRATSATRCGRWSGIRSRRCRVRTAPPPSASGCTRRAAAGSLRCCCCRSLLWQGQQDAAGARHGRTDRGTGALSRRVRPATDAVAGRGAPHRAADHRQGKALVARRAASGTEGGVRDGRRAPALAMDFAITCSLVQPGRPHIRFLFVRSWLCSTLPSDPTSR